VCTIYEIGKANDGSMFIVMRHYEGRTLRAHIADGPLQLDDAVAYAAGVADGLARAHAKNILHRDIKPANLMVTEENVVKILDFGLAKLTEQARVTRTGAILGTLEYMSPEMAQGKSSDHRADIFSLGVTLYEMVTGKCPFHADNQAGIMYKIVHEDPTPPRRLRGDLSGGLERVILKALEKDPGWRYQSMLEFRDDLLQVTGGTAPGHPVPPAHRPETTAPWKRIVRRYAAGIGVAALVLVIGLNWDSVIKPFLGGGGFGDSKGIVVLPFDVQAAGPEAAWIAAGIGADVADRLTSLAEFEPALWVVPPRKTQGSGVTEPAKANAAYGVNAVLTGTLQGMGENGGLEIVLLDASTLDPIETRDVSTGGPQSGFMNLDDELADLLKIEREPGGVTGGSRYTKVIGAYTAFLSGLGYLASEEDSLVDSALVAFDRAIAMDSLFVAAHVRRAEALFRMGASLGDSSLVNRALETCLAALRLDDTQASAHVLLGNIRSHLGDKEGALEDFTDARARNPRDIDARRRLAWTHLELSQLDKAEEAYQEAIEVNSRYWGTYEDLGYFYYVARRYDDAVAEFRTVSDLAPDHAPTYNYLGAIFYYQEKWDEAIAMFERSFALDKTYAACSNLGTLYYMKGRFKDAVAMYEWAREYYPSDHVVVGNIAAAYKWIPEEREQGKRFLAEAIELAEKRRAESPNDAVLLSFLAGCYAPSDKEAAVRHAERALSLSGDNAEVLFRCAAAYEDMGQRTRALVLLGDAIKHGYSLKMIAHEPYFQELRKDPRYDLLISEHVEESS
jgi:serine/threonine-protein kinase